MIRQTTKFEFYKALPSFGHYLLVDIRRVQVIYYRKLGPNEWLQHTSSALTDILQLPDFELDLALSAIYAKVEVPNLPESLR